MLISLLVFIIVLGLVYWAVSLIPLPEPFGQIVKVLFVLIAVLGILDVLGITHFGLLR